MKRPILILALVALATGSAVAQSPPTEPLTAPDPTLARIKGSHDRTKDALIRLIKANQSIYENLARTIHVIDTDKYNSQLGQIEEAYRQIAFNIEGITVNLEDMARGAEQLARDMESIQR